MLPVNVALLIKHEGSIFCRKIGLSTLPLPSFSSPPTRLPLNQEILGKSRDFIFNQKKAGEKKDILKIQGKSGKFYCFISER